MKTVEKYGVLFSVGGTAHIRALIEEGVNNGSRTATVTGAWDIESHIRIPSDFTLILDGCYLKMADGTFDNMFVNEHHGTELGNTVAGTDRNIRILGKNGAIIDGGTYNGLSEQNSRKDGMPPIYMNNLIFFTNVDGIEMADFALHNFRWWAVNFIYCANGYIHDITLKGDDTCFDKDGNEYHGLSLENYFDMRIRQADGIDLRKGCHHFLIENIYGFTGDDTVALTCLPGRMEKEFGVEELPEDLSHVMVRHVHSASLDAGVRILCQGGTTLHDVIVDDVADISDQIPGILGRALQTVRIGDSDKMYGSRHSEGREVYNVTVKNIRSRAKYALYIAGNPIENFVCENVVAFDGGEIVDNRWEGYEFTAGRKE